MSIAENKPWATLAYQDALRPPVGMRTGWALLTTYSAELRGVAAALLALAGSERENSGGTAMQLASAVQQLRGKVHVALQSGRLARPRGVRQKMGVMLDSFVYHVDRDERRSSWHPKIALVRFDALDEESPNPHWRLWIGSRNLTGSENLELGVVLEQASAGGVEIEGLTNSLTWLATEVGLISRKVRKEMHELSSVRWLLPDEWKQIAIRMHGQGADRNLPKAPDLVKELVIVSPFVDAATLRELSGWAEDGKRHLISTRDALRKIVAETPEVLAGWSLSALSKPNYPEEKEDGPEGAEEDDSSDIEQDEVLGFSLHAKLIAALCGKKDVRIWMGSANATARGWSGRNVECVVEVLARSETWSGVSDLIGRAEPVSIQSLQSQIEAPDDSAERLEAARKRIVRKWNVRLQHVGDIFSAVSDDPLDPNDDEIGVRVGMLSQPVVPWPKDAKAVAVGEVRLARQSHFLQVCLLLGECSACWLMHCPMEPEMAAGRDAAAIAEALRPSELLKLWASELKDIRSEDEGPEWDGARRGKSPEGPAASEDEMLTLEDILIYWGRREANEFEQIAERWGAVLCKMKEQPKWSVDADAERLEGLYTICLKLAERATR
jgi:hypothetical protein